MLKSRPDALAVYMSAHTCECPHHLHVLRERHRSGAGVLIGVQALLCPIAAEIGQRVTVARRAGPGGASHLEQLLSPGLFDQRLENRVRQPHPIGELGAGGLAAVQPLEQQLMQLLGREAGRGERRRRWRGVDGRPSERVNYLCGCLDHTPRGAVSLTSCWS